MKTWMLLVALVLAAAPANAQSARRVPGYWVGLAPAAASAGLSCGACADTESRIGPSAALTLGYALTSRWGVGLELSGWRKPINGTVDHQGYLMATAFFFPNQGGAYLTGGIGLARFASVIGREDDRTSSLGAGWRIGAGYEVAFGREVSLAPFINYFRSLSTSLKINGNSTGTKLSQHMIQAGVGLHWNFSGAISFPKPT